MPAMMQKKITISADQEKFLAAYKEYGFPDQSSLIRSALDNYIIEVKRNQRRSRIAKKASELADLYKQDSELTAFIAIDGDDFYEPS